MFLKKIYSRAYYKLHTTLIEEVRKNQLHIRIGNAFSRAAATSSIRQIDLRHPLTWEFSGFSQNGEDGILDVLISNLKTSNRYFFEIGANNCIDNNTAWLSYARNFSGLMIEGDSFLFQKSYDTKPWYVDYHNLFVDLDNIKTIKELLLYTNPDVFSLDIDGNDYFIARSILEAGILPKVIVIEYNSAYGPDQLLSIKYNKNFCVRTAHPSCLYYGVSIALLKELLSDFGYRFVTVDSNGVNAFFVNPSYYDTAFLNDLMPIHYRENSHQFRLIKGGWEEQFELIKHLPYIEF
jgi:hypothetical protein